jgi:hypothetical protein
MVNWGEQQDMDLGRAIKNREIDPHNLDGTWLFGKTVQLFEGYQGDGTPEAKANVIAQLRKKPELCCWKDVLGKIVMFFLVIRLSKYHVRTYGIIVHIICTYLGIIF